MLKGQGYVGWHDDLLAALGVDEAAVVGVSLGGWIALQYAIARPERVGKLALLCPGGVTALRTSWMLRLIALSLARLSKLPPQFQAALLPEAGHVLLDTPVPVMPFLELV